jgi:para-nitrobenzyl esterase
VSAAANGANPGSALRFGPIVDGKVLPRSTNDLPKGAFNDTPVLTGLTADEGSGLQPNYGKATVAEFSAQLDRTFGDKAVQARSFYPAANDAEAGESAKVLVRERGLAATYGWAVDRASKSSNPVYLYYFTHVEPGPESARYGAFHSSEIPYVFQTLDKSPARPFTAQDRGLSETMAAYWVNFARSGDPNGGALPKWPAFDPEAPRLLELKPQPEARPVLPGDRLEFYNSHVDGGGRVSLF